MFKQKLMPFILSLNKVKWSLLPLPAITHEEHKDMCELSNQAAGTSLYEGMTLPRWERIFWFACFWVFAVATLVFVVLDGAFLLNHGSKYLANLVIFLVLLFLAAYIHVWIIDACRGVSHPCPWYPETLRVLILTGPAFAIVITLVLYLRDAPIGFHLWMASQMAPFASFSIMMLLRPVPTDLGFFYPFCVIPIGLAYNAYDIGKAMWISYGLGFFLMISKDIVEFCSIRAARLAAERNSGYVTLGVDQTTSSDSVAAHS